MNIDYEPSHRIPAPIDYTRCRGAYQSPGGWSLTQCIRPPTRGNPPKWCSWHGPKVLPQSREELLAGVPTWKEFWARYGKSPPTV